MSLLVSNLYIYKKNISGAISVLVALLLIPLLLGIGVGLDFHRAFTVRSRLQAASDAYAFAIAREKAQGTYTSASEQKLKNYFISNFIVSPSDQVNWYKYTPEINTTTGQVTVTATAGVGTTILKLVNYQEIPVGVLAQAGASAGQPVELALVLDTTTSLRDDGREAALKKAGATFIDALENVFGSTGLLRIGVVPYTGIVNVGTAYKSAPWIDFGGKSSSSWTGCVVDRDPPYDTNNTLPSAATPATLYDAYFHQPFGPGDQDGCATKDLAVVVPLTTDLDVVRNLISNMKLYRGTNIPIALSWGWNLVTPGQPLGPTSERPNAKRVIVVLTDGTNTYDKWGNYYEDDRLQVQARVDVRMKTLCAAIKADGVTIYSINIIEGTASLLRECASQPGYFFDVQSLNKLEPAFQSIAQSVAAGSLLRLTE